MRDGQLRLFLPMETKPLSAFEFAYDHFEEDGSPLQSVTRQLVPPRRKAA